MSLVKWLKDVEIARHCLSKPMPCSCGHAIIALFGGMNLESIWHLWTPRVRGNLTGPSSYSDGPI